MTVSRPVKILALVLVIAGVGGIASLSMLGKSSPAATSNLSVEQIRTRAHAQTGTTPSATTTSTTATTTAAAAAPTHAKATPHPQPHPKPKPAPVVAANGLPTILNDALHRHRVVVVSVFDPQSQTDAVSYAEARAGAGDVHVAGFLGVSVLDDTVAGPLTAALPGGGLLPVPGVLIYRRPGTLIERIDGFADRASIAQLALTALTAPPLADATTTATTATTPAPAPVTTTPTTTTTP